MSSQAQLRWWPLSFVSELMSPTQGPCRPPGSCIRARPTLSSPGGSPALVPQCLLPRGVPKEMSEDSENSRLGTEPGSALGHRCCYRVPVTRLTPGQAVLWQPADPAQARAMKWLSKATGRRAADLGSTPALTLGRAGGQAVSLRPAVGTRWSSYQIRTWDALCPAAAPCRVPAS